MALIDETSAAAIRRGKPHTESLAAAASMFAFVPGELATKCRKLIETYHAMHGFGSLPDLLWQSDGRDVVECNRELAQVFKRASKTRRAKRANDALLQIATAVVSLEVLARDFAGWGKRFPEAKQAAETLLVGFPSQQRVWLMDMYLYPPLGIHRELVSTLAPAMTGELPTLAN